MGTKLNTKLGQALVDVKRGFARHELWLFIGWRDVKKHYSRSIIGPFWLTLSMGMMVLGLGFLYSQIFQIDVVIYLPKLAIGLILWGLLNGLVTGACNVFITAGHSLRQLRIPLSVYIFQFVWSQVLTFAHNFFIYIVIVIVFMITPGWNIILFVPALTLILLNGLFITMILGPLCARFRDVPMMIASFMQLFFFLTPIIWNVEQLPQRAWFVMINPFFHLIEIVRDPLLGGTATSANWSVSIVLTAFLGIVAVLFFARYRARIAYWS